MFKQNSRSLMLVLCATVMMLFGNTLAAYADSVPGGNVSDPIVRAVDIAEPAVVRVLTLLNGHLLVRFSTGSVTFPQNNGSPYPLGLSGSGTFISAHGDVLTADHVVNPPHDTQLSQYLDSQAAPDVAVYINQHPQLGLSQVTADQVTQALTTGQLPSDPQYSTPISEVFLSTAYTGTLNATDLGTIPGQYRARVDKIENQSPVDQKDTAIIHVALQDTPMVQLGDSSTVQKQDQLTIIGFPGNGDVNQTNPTDLLTSSVNKIIVSSIKTTEAGAPLIQVGGNVEQGDSGGPAIDSNGDVVGIVSFGIIANGVSGGTSFLQASNSARGLVTGLDTTPGPFQKLWSQSFMDYAATTPGHWHNALQRFQQLQAQYPQFHALTPFLNYTQTQAAKETTVAQSKNTATNGAVLSSPTTTMIVSILAVLVLLAILVFFLARMLFRPAAASTHSAAMAPQPIQAPPPLQRGMNEDLTAFGAPPKAIPPYQMPMQQQPRMPDTMTDLTSRLWSCGHINRPTARFCSTCGEPAPPPNTHYLQQ